jgi:hypothetical protein
MEAPPQIKDHGITWGDKAKATKRVPKKAAR